MYQKLLSSALWVQQMILYEHNGVIKRKATHKLATIPYWIFRTQTNKRWKNFVEKMQLGWLKMFVLFLSLKRRNMLKQSKVSPFSIYRNPIAMFSRSRLRAKPREYMIFVNLAFGVLSWCYLFPDWMVTDVDKFDI